MEKNGVVLREGKEKTVELRHHWIFSGAIASWPREFKNGEIYPIFSAAGVFLAQGYFQNHTTIAGRILSWDDQPIETVLRAKLERSERWRREWFDEKHTTGYRLVHGEGDGIPGLVVDRYGDVLVSQFTTLGMDRLKPLIVSLLAEIFKPVGIYEKSVLPSRRQEGLEDVQGWLYGSVPEPVRMLENGLQFLVDLSDSQKTGFFLDQRQMRQLVRDTSWNRTVLNCFSYTGGFSVAALAGGAIKVDSVDTSAPAIELAKQNIELNGHRNAENGFFTEDVFTFLRDYELPYSLIILDPPAFAKKKDDVPQAMRGYREINRLAIEKAQPHSYLLTSSCSAHVDEVLFQKVVFQAAVASGREVRIIEKHRLAADHPINIYHPETSYLKSLWLAIE